MLPAITAAMKEEKCYEDCRGSQNDDITPKLAKAIVCVINAKANAYQIDGIPNAVTQSFESIVPYPAKTDEQEK
ncbi:MAG TPA: hypothetical protein PK511_15290 [Chitinophagales bacterium]|nr:hypothetical protein [Chitinophagales bacterium]HMX05442.1 hypothetical protein [Chitinophagales bacterium]HNA58520.1 hypothetical protein [Chitinophagales bacterium]HNE46706.1 hypothetical protein [Chitinophagales bacterium]HNF69867.1 hypothetical protein [Chitinophagales bacterium]